MMCSVVCCLLFVVTQDTTVHRTGRMTRSCRPWLWVRKYQGEREKVVAYCLLWCSCGVVVVVGSPHILNIDQLTADHSAQSVDVC